MLTHCKRFFCSRPRYQRVIAYLFAAYAGYAVALGLLVPYAIKNYAPETLSTLLGRPVTLADIRINPFNYKVEINQFAIAEKDQHAFVSIERIKLQAHFWQSLFKQALVLEKIDIKAPIAHVVRNQEQGDPQFNFSDILQTLAKNTQTAPAETPAQTDAKPLRVLLGQLSIEAGQFFFNDKPTQAKLRYPDINLKLSQLDTEYLFEQAVKDAVVMSQHSPTAPTTLTSDNTQLPATATKQTEAIVAAQSEPNANEPTKVLRASSAIKVANTTSAPSAQHNHFRLQIVDDKAGNISLSGQFQLTPLHVQGDVQMAKLQLTPLWQFVAEQFNVQLTAGQISAKTHYQLSQPNDAPLSLQTRDGQMIIEQLNIADNTRPVLTLPLFAIEGIASDVLQQRVHIRKVHSQGLALHGVLDKDGIDLATLFQPKNTAKKSTQSQMTVAPADTASQTAAKFVATEKAAANATAQKAEASNDNTQDTTETVIAKVEMPSPAGASTSAQPAENAPWLVTLDALALKDFDIQLSEKMLTSSTQQWRIYPLNMSTQAIRSDLTQPIAFDINLKINNSGQFSSQGQVDIPAESINAQLQLEQLALNQFQPYLAPYINIQLKSGLLSTKGHLSADSKGAAIYQGEVELNEFTVFENLHNAPLVKWQKMHINQLNFDQQKQKIHIDHLAFKQPYAKVVIAKDRSTNISDLIVTAPTAIESQKVAVASTTIEPNTIAKRKTQGQQGAANKPELSLDIQKISFSQGSAYFADNSLTPNFASGIEELQGQITHLSSNAGTTASVDIKGKIDKYAPVTLKGDVNPLLDMPYLDLDLVFKSVELTSVNPYSGTYAGYYIDKGQLSLALNYKLEKNQLKGSNHLVIDQLELGKPSDSSLATSLPITLAIALLQDRHGVIDLGMEVSGDLDSPSFSVGSIIWTAISNVITKAVTAPFSFIANLVGSDETLDKITFAAGSDVLDTKAQSSLDKLATGLIDRPMLKLSVEGEVDAVNDSQALATAFMQQKLAKIAGMEMSALPADLSPSQFPTTGPLADALLKLYEQEVNADPELIKENVIQETGDTALTEDELLTRWHIALYNLSVKAQDVDDDMLGQLAQARAKAVKSYLIDTKNITPERVFLIESRVSLTQNLSQVSLELAAQ